MTKQEEISEIITELVNEGKIPFLRVRDTLVIADAVSRAPAAAPLDPTSRRQEIARIDELLNRRDESDAGYAAFVYMRKLWPWLKDAYLNGAPSQSFDSTTNAAASWQPITDLVPEHDNPNVLVVDQGIVSEAYYSGESDTWFKAGKSEHDFDFVSGDRLYPTHWMPMPAPPSTISRPNQPSQEKSHD